MSHDNFDENRFAEEFDRLFEQSEYSKRDPYDLERLANLPAPEETANAQDAVPLDADTIDAFCTLLLENRGGGVPSVEAAAEKAQVLRRVRKSYEHLAPGENEEYLAAWQGFYSAGRSVSRVLKPCGGEAARFAEALDAEQCAETFESLQLGPSQAQTRNFAPHIRTRVEATPLLAHVANRRRLYENIQNGIEAEESLGHVLIILGLAVEACARLEETLQQIAHGETKIN